MVPYVEGLLKEHEAVIVSPWCGVDFFAPFGQRIYVDIEEGLGLSLWKYLGDEAAKYGLSIAVEQRYALAGRRRWPGIPIYVYRRHQCTGGV